MAMLKAIVISMRPRQWVKNLFVLAGLVFSQRLFTGAVWTALAAFAIVCALSGAIYLLNDVADRERDRLDPRKRVRPIAAGRLPVGIAVVTASTVTAYALYTMSPETVAKFHTHLLPATLPFVLYGIFRYLYLLYRRQLGGNPSELFLNDKALLINTLGWIFAVLLIIYGARLE